MAPWRTGDLAKVLENAKVCRRGKYRLCSTHRASQLTERLWAGSRWQDHDLIFTSTIGTPVSSGDVTKRFQALIRAAELPRLRFHDLRHGCASLLLAQGVHPRVVMEQIGHSTIALTMNVYSHVIPALQRDAADRMDALLGATS
jgi:integrase